MSRAEIPIIITRADPGARETADRVMALGRRPMVAPMLSLRVLSETSLHDTDTLSGLVFTSANGVRTYAKRCASRTLTAWCVGPATAQAAREMGFAAVQESAGNAVDLAQFIASRSAPETKPLLHVANTAAAGTLRATLEGLGYKVTFAPIYEMVPARALPIKVARALAEPGPAIILVHSEKGASAFANVARHIETSNCVGVAISDRASAPLEPLKLDAIYTAKSPNEDGLFEALGTALATLSA